MQTKVCEISTVGQYKMHTFLRFVFEMYHDLETRVRGHLIMSDDHQQILHTVLSQLPVAFDPLTLIQQCI